MVGSFHYNGGWMPKEMLKIGIIGQRKRGRLRRRWLQDVEGELRVMRTRNWRRTALVAFHIIIQLIFLEC